MKGRSTRTEDIQKTFPFPDSRRICDAPCRDACLRQGEGGSPRAGALERFCADEGSFRRPRILVPKTGRTAAVLVAVSAPLRRLLTAPGRLSVTVFRAENGGRELLSLSPLLTVGCCEEELEGWKSWAFTSFPGMLRHSEGLAERFDAVYAGLDDPLCRSFPELLERGDPVSLETAVPGVLLEGTPHPSFSGLPQAAGE